MEPIWLHAKAPFAAFRWLQAGVYRATSPVMPPSAAWGLVLNLANVEVRQRGEPGATTTIREDAPSLRIAVGSVAEAERNHLYQQLHSYPVGNSGAATLGPRAHGAKFWIAPARREILVGFDCVIGVVTREASLADRIVRGLRGDLDEPRYGLPFAGDNNLLFDSIDLVTTPPSCHWYERVDTASGPMPGSCRLTVAIDRADASKTQTLVFAPTSTSTPIPPEGAWVWTPTAPA